MHFEIPESKAQRVETLKGKEERKPHISLEALENICEDDPVLLELLQSMIDMCLEYTITVAKFKEIVTRTEGKVTDDRMEIDKIRGTVHDATMDSINIFSRALAKAGKDNSWMAEMIGDRNKYGRFALTLTLSRL